MRLRRQLTEVAVDGVRVSERPRDVHVDAGRVKDEAGEAVLQSNELDNNTLGTHVL